MKAARAVARFLYDFIVGDDWKIAAAVVVSLGLSTALLVGSDLSDGSLVLVGSGLLLLTFVASMAVDVRRSRR